jgi:cystathionine gamma-synthase
VLVVDNTFASPYLQQPLALGADSSSTRRRSTWAATPTSSAASSSATTSSLRHAEVPPERGRRRAGPLDCWLTLRGIKTLAVRMDRHSGQRPAVAEFLGEQTRSSASTTPACRTTPGTRSRARQMRGFSGMVSFTLRGGYEARGSGGATRSSPWPRAWAASSR